jgi:hypothetical protein
MHRSLTAVLLCIFAQAAAAQCEAPAPAAQEVRHGADLAKNKPVPPGTTAKGELIKTAAAGTHDEVRPTVRSAPTGRTAEHDEHRRGGPAMLLAALALMSGIALRRFGAHK